MEETKFIRSAEINEVAAALSVFQGKVKQPEKKKDVTVTSKSTNTKYKFKYADLSECVSVATPALSECGLSVSQIVAGGQLITLLLHKSGQYIGSELNLGAQQITKYQDFGSAMTYLKRYSYCAILGLVADDDDDANVADANTMTTNPPQQSASYTPKELKVSLEDIARCVTDDELINVWNDYNTRIPALCRPNTEFYKSFVAKRRSISKTQQ